MRKPRRPKHAAGVPHLTRQRGVHRTWYGMLDGVEVSLHTQDPKLAFTRLVDLGRRTADGSRTAPTPRREEASALAPSTTSSKLTVLAASFADYVQPPRHTPKTASKYENAVLRFVTWCEPLGVSRVNEVTVQLLSRFLRHLMADGCGPASCNRHASALNAFLRFGVAENAITDNPLEGNALRRLRLREPRPRPDATTLSNKQVALVVKTAREICHVAYAAFIEATAGSGARLDEMRHVDLADIDEAKGYLTITPKPGWVTKNYRYRTIPVSAATIAALKTLIAHRKEVAMDDRALWGQIDLVRRELPGLPKFAWHDLRRAWASSMHAAGASLKRVSYWLGHSGIQVTERYIRLVETEGGHEFLPR